MRFQYIKITKLYIYFNINNIFILDTYLFIYFFLFDSM